MLRLTLISLPIALLLLAALYGPQYDVTFPGQGVLRFPAVGLDYMAVFFHELGHTLAFWSFGEPALPTFDWDEGGGMTYAFDRSRLLQGAAWAVMAGGLAALWANGARGFFALGAVAALFLFAASFNSTAREAISTYMGHGGEILVACFCLFRALTNTVEGDKAVERPLAMIFGLYTLGRNVILCRMLASPEGQEFYDNQKSHVQGDFRHLSELLNMRIERAAHLSLVLMAVVLTLTIAAAMWARGDES